MNIVPHQEYVQQHYALCRACFISATQIVVFMEPKAPKSSEAKGTEISIHDYIQSRPLLTGPVDNRFRFIAIQNPDAAKDPVTKRMARSHAVKNALRAKRERQNKSNIDFRIVGAPEAAQQPLDEDVPSPVQALLYPDGGAIDPFGMLDADSSRLKYLLKEGTSKLSSTALHSTYFSTDSRVNNVRHSCDN